MNGRGMSALAHSRCLPPAHLVLRAFEQVIDLGACRREVGPCRFEVGSHRRFQDGACDGVARDEKPAAGDGGNSCLHATASGWRGS